MRKNLKKNIYSSEKEYININKTKGFPGGSDDKESASNAGDLGSIPRSQDPLEKGMATYSSVLPSIIPWKEKPRGL